MCVCPWSWAGIPECPRVRARNGEGLSVPGNVLVHVLVCWVRICHGMLRFSGILSVPVWAFAGFINLYPLGLLCPLEADHLVVFSIGPIVCVCLASLRKWVWVIPFRSLPQISAPPQPKSHLSLCLHHHVLPCFAHCKSLPLPSDYQFSVTDTKYIFAG